MMLKDAVTAVEKKFPFPGYMDATRYPYINIGNTAIRYLSSGARILDVGSGPCDKTAVLAALGFRCTAYDDFKDGWHTKGGNMEKINAFCNEFGIDLVTTMSNDLPFAPDSFDMVMMHDVLEHIHNSPRDFLNKLVTFIKPGGYFFTTVPNAVNIRKRLDVMRGKTNLARFDNYYWHLGDIWRGHVREYTKDDLYKLNSYLNLTPVELYSCHHMLRKLPLSIRPLYRAITWIFPGWRDTWSLLGRKEGGWKPNTDLTNEELKRIYNVELSYADTH